VLLLQRRVGNGAVGRLLSVQRRETEEDPASAPAGGLAGEPAPGGMEREDGDLEREDAGAEREKPPEVAVGEGHHVTVREVGGEPRLGIASEFKEIRRVIQALPDDLRNSAEVVEAAAEVAKVEKKLKDLAAARDAAHLNAGTLRERANETLRTQGRTNTYRVHLARYNLAATRWHDSRHAHGAEEAAAVEFAKVVHNRLWEIGKGHLDVTLMPKSTVYRDKAAFRGDADDYWYHTGEADDPIPIIWYKRPEDYPHLRVHGTPFAFGQSFTIGGTTFGVAGENRPRVGWRLRKTMHNETREGQRSLNRVLLDKRVEVMVNGAFVEPAVGQNRFDGDHVKDLGFGGTDTADNYWPLDAKINRRAFTGYNSGYVVNYVDAATGEPRSRAIGGLVGKHFEVRGFLGPGDPPVPQDPAAAGGSKRVWIVRMWKRMRR
jgi:hypothetical protein